MKVIVSLGSNKNQIENIEIAEKELKAFFSAIRFSTTQYTGDGYYNAVGVGESSLSYDELKALTKNLEKKLGRTDDRETIPIDVDILEHNGHCHKPEDMAREYNIILLKELE
ncbi:hypothetical protein HPS57_01350 [Prevotella sp. PINT]|jgi:7,8-dihydro-6-hydroxymethylpterin-pyrophosphokinase|uniref:2-amino-4-hydroxy-6- hydroxymethyldihydropteridine diphosphokinase n=1 Tax=Palleniella intestinalis TaxID=2736291 RepID=UPI001557AC5F|nr:2-amino-4-hydroxy-6-hydroxymethyldihydropteridine diphosphokinase [Palleniella intestinalis]NPD80632.1 hypothetical protein [Palleniella intestinalis]